MEKKTAVRIVTVALLLILIAGAACAVLVTCTAHTPLEGARVTAINTFLDKTGAKTRIESELHAQAGKISEQTGLPVEVVNSGIEMLDIEDWEVTTLPADAVSVGTFETDYKGKTVKVTTYEDASYVTVDAYGQSITFNVPESAQTFTEMAPYLHSAQDLGLIGF